MAVAFQLSAGATHEDVRYVVVQVLEGESYNPDECAMIGRTVIRNLPANLPQGSPVTVTYEYGTNGRLNVRAKMVWTHQEVRLELERAASLSQDRLKSWKGAVQQPDAGLDDFDQMVQEELAHLRREAAEMGLAMPGKPG